MTRGAGAKPNGVGRVGLVLSGGGARAAYQAGALCGLAELLGHSSSPFSLLTGVSAGAINAVSVASRADDFQAGTQNLAEMWTKISPEHVYRTDAASLSFIGSRWLRELGGGGLLGSGATNHLLDTTPLREFLAKRLSFEAVGQHLRSGVAGAVAVSATNYTTGISVTFYDEGSESSPIKPWVRSARIGVKTTLGLEHVLASAAIPIFFPPIEIDGAFYGDGSVRLTSPLSPAIHLGAERIVAIGVRYLRSAAGTTLLQDRKRPTAPSLSEIGGVLLNAVFLDALEGDAERLERINRTIPRMRDDEQGSALPLRSIPLLVLRPSRDLGELAGQQDAHLPMMLRYLLRGIGVRGNRGADLLSYLAFSPEYVGRLLELGYGDTLARRDEILRFFSESEGSAFRE